MIHIDRSILCFTGLLLLATCTAPSTIAAASDAKLTTPGEIHSRFVRVTSADRQGAKPLRWSGTFEWPPRRLIGRFEIYAAPGRSLQRFDLGKGDVVLRAIDGATGWKREVFWDATDVKEAELDELAEMSRCWEPIGGADNNAKADPVAPATFESTRCYRLRTRRDRANAAAADALEYYDTDTGLLIGRSVGPRTWLFGSYKDFEGVQRPTKLRLKVNGALQEVYTVEKVDPAADTPSFERPDPLLCMPPGWYARAEPFPPPWAKDLPWTGELKLRFSPGWGKADDSFYWSYAILYHLDGDALKTKDELERVLRRYDAGLYGKSFPAEKIAIEIRDNPPADDKEGHTVTHYSVTLHGFDPEVKKQELTTHIEVRRWHCPKDGHTFVVLLRSPRQFAEDDAVWKALAPFYRDVRCHHSDRAEPSPGAKQP